MSRSIKQGGTLAVPAEAGSYVKTTMNTLVGAVGDSITRNGNNPPTSTTGPTYDARSYLQWAAAASNGTLRIGPTAATGGYTTAQILADHIPTMIANYPRPAYCIVHAGTNDIGYGNVSAVTTRSNLMAMWKALDAAGITPVLTTIMPRSTLTVSVAAQTLNAWISRQALLNGWPLVDFYSAFVDPTSNGTIIASYSGDGLHPNSLGASVLGNAIASVLSRITNGAARTPPYLATANTWNNVVNGSENNALFLNATAGLPTGWTLSGGTTAATALSVSPMAANEGVGNWFNFTSATAGSAYQTGAMQLPPGHRIALGFKYKTSGLGAGKLSLALNWGGPMWKWGDDIANDITLGTIYQELVVPPSHSTGYARFQVWVIGGAATASIGQFTCIDLTALGIDG